MAWNFDMAAAPRGETETLTVLREGKPTTRQVHRNARIIAAAGGDDPTVTISYWIPDQERWCHFTKEHPPVAWQPWPDHPRAM